MPTTATRCLSAAVGQAPMQRALVLRAAGPARLDASLPRSPDHSRRSIPASSGWPKSIDLRPQSSCQAPPVRFQGESWFGRGRGLGAGLQRRNGDRRDPLRQARPRGRTCGFRGFSKLPRTFPASPASLRRERSLRNFSKGTPVLAPAMSLAARNSAVDAA
jgi:hypothetical protein